MAGIGDATVIDIHAHAVLAETMGRAGAYGPEIGFDDDDTPWFRIGDYRLMGVRYVGSPFMDVDLRVQRMDDAGIDFQVLSPNPLTYFHFIPEAEAIAFCQTHNDALAATVARHPNRLAGLAALPIQNPVAAIEELTRSVKELGLWGGYIGTACPLPLDDPAFDKFYDAFVSLDVPLFIHPSPAGIDGPPGDPVLKRFDLDLLVGFAQQETAVLATLIYGGVPHRHPKLDICISHGGGMIAFAAGRLSQAAAKRPWAPQWLKADGAFEEAMAAIWYDTHVHDDRALALLKEVVGGERLVFGTNFAGWDQPEKVHIGPDAATLGANARRLLRQEGR
ncbi:MAG: amidohydrolase family protein [Alphaproteobacteria bacterium]|jgi:aminocarboxymuconate-semialdehyde decarboxylase|nr:amidohydrolase family protein [Alphaproteobacteria bacterium]